MKVHHYTPTDKICGICGEPIMTAWYDAEEKNGRSETFQERSGGVVVHYWCTDNPKTLQEINEERRKSK